MPNLEYQRELAANSYDAFHKIFIGFIGLLGTILQTTNQPFKTHYPKAVAFVVTIVIYFSSLLAELILRNNGRDHVIVNILSLFSGGLAVIMPILIIVSAVGWLALGIWVCVFGIVAYCLFDKIRDDFVKIVAEFKNIMNKLGNGHANGRQGEQNGNANESGDEQNDNANESMDSFAVTMPVNEQNDNPVNEQSNNANESMGGFAVTMPVNEQSNNANESMGSFAVTMPVNVV